MDKKTILFICTHNSARSQMAEGLVNYYYKNSWKAYSAGTEKTKVKQLAIKAMADIEIDISNHSSKTYHKFLEKNLDYVVTVCNSVKEKCPLFPSASKHIHAGFTDPSDATGDENEKLQAFIETRNEIKNWLDKTIVSW